MGKTVDWIVNGQLTSTYVNCTEDFVKELKKRAKKEGAEIVIR